MVAPSKSKDGAIHLPSLALTSPVSQLFHDDQLFHNSQSRCNTRFFEYRQNSRESLFSLQVVRNVCQVARCKFSLFSIIKISRS